jgi:hypothetical protein
MPLSPSPAALLLTILMLALPAARSAYADTPTPPAVPPAGEAPGLNPEAIRIMRRLSDSYIQAQAFQVRISALVVEEADGTRQEHETRFLVSVERPNRLALVQQAGPPERTALCDGRTLEIRMPGQTRHTRPAPAVFDAFCQELLAVASAELPFASALIAEDPYATLMEGVIRAEVIGKETVAGAECVRLRFTQKDFHWDAWVETGPRPLLRRVRPHLADAIRSGLKTGHTFSVQIEIAFDHWLVADRLPAGTFPDIPTPVQAGAAESPAPNPAR